MGSFIHTKAGRTLTPEASAALSAILYFDLFDYPLTLSEVIRFAPYKQNGEQEVVRGLAELVQQNLVIEEGMFFHVSDRPGVVSRRVKGNHRASQYLKLARLISRFIAQFPFVRGVGLSGTISKNFMDRKSDLDFFVITEPNRLWLCRSLLMAFKKIFLFNSHRFFCINYFIDTDSLEIEDRNIFTATEVVTLKPTYNSRLFREFRGANAWTRPYFPNDCEMQEWKITGRHSLFKRGLEKLLSRSMFDRLEEFSLKTTIRYWKRKFPDMDASAFELALRSKKNVSKHHPSNFQERVLGRYTDNIRRFEERHNVVLSHAVADPETSHNRPTMVSC